MPASMDTSSGVTLAEVNLASKKERRRRRRKRGKRQATDIEVVQNAGQVDQNVDGHISTKPEGSKPDANLDVDSTPKLTQEPQKPDSVSTTDPLEKSVCMRKKKKKQKATKKVDGVYGSQGMDHADILSNLSLADACNQPTNGTINRIMTTDQGPGISMTKESVIPPLQCANNAEYLSNVANGGLNVLVVPRHIAARSPVCSRRKLLILDINGLLADIVMPPPLDCKADTHISGRAIFKRPFYYDFLKFCCERFDVGIWSSRSKRIIDRVVDYLLGDLKHKLLFCWDMYQCTDTGFRTLENRHKPLVCKELRKLWEKHYPDLPWEKGDYDESNTLLVDDSPYKALLNPIHTGIFPHSYCYRDTSDNSLGPGGDLRVYLEGLALTEHIPKHIEQHPFGQKAIDETSSLWGFYSRVLHRLSGQSIRDTDPLSFSYV
ncbi:uncharacterized protein [Coffea arabica]|uniref:Mitochondrial import inner membrane translocase subunit TIM50 n=1 Tax=Coffea arabica TaxID=13443 RepID=A0A6P6T666_COFAR|nr:uncharacterized protein LOC113698270 [Coffea arabica]XP_027073834.1 uncharacterized protein LOC113698270 [Coffea arabica]XP_027073835.1 uncharacterized protein LOC113698270 [Coffea arabica]